MCPFAGLGFFVPFCGFCLFMPSAGLGFFHPLWVFLLCPVQAVLCWCPVQVLCVCAQCGSCLFVAQCGARVNVPSAGLVGLAQCGFVGVSAVVFSAENLDFWVCPVFLLIFALCAIGRFGLLPCSRSPQRRPLCRARECRFVGCCFCFEQHDAKLKFGF